MNKTLCWEGKTEIESGQLFSYFITDFHKGAAG